MATGLTNLVPDAYVALNTVSRELCGLIPSATLLPGIERLAVGQSLRSAVAPINTAGRDITPAMSLPSASEQPIGNVPFTITKSRAFPFSWGGEDALGVDAGPGFLTVQQNQIAEAMRAAIKEICVDGYAVARKGASRAYGTAGTTPFASTLGASAQLKKILDDNGAPQSDRALVMDTTAGANLRTLLNNPLNANQSLQAGELAKQGVLIDVNGFVHREDAAITAVTAGTGSGYLLNNSGGYAVGDTALTVDTGTGTILAGDVITIAGDSNKYVVKTALASNVVTIAAPGLLKAAADNAAITVGSAFTGNLGFSRNALALGTRLPALAPGGRDIAIMRETLIDDVSKIAFELAAYPGYRMVTFEIGIAWGWAVEKPEHCALLLG